MTNESVELKAHKRIWLQQEGETTWCQDKINDDDIEYVLATPPQSPEAKIAEGLKGINIKKLSRKTADKLQGKNGWDYQPTDVRDVLNTLLAVCETDKEEDKNG